MSLLGKGVSIIPKRAVSRAESGSDLIRNDFRNVRLSPPPLVFQVLFRSKRLHPVRVKYNEKEKERLGVMYIRLRRLNIEEKS